MSTMSLSKKYNHWTSRYPKILKDNKKIGHNIHIGFELVERILDDLFDEFRNKSTDPAKEKFLVPVNFEFIIGLMFYKGIKSNMITFLGDEDRFSKQVAKSLNICYYNINDVAVDYEKSNEVKEIMKSKLNDFHVIQNPQFDEPIPGKKQTRKVWPKRTQLGLALTGNNKYHIPIIPYSWLESNDAKLKKTRNIILEHDLITQKNGVETQFPSQPGVGIGYSIIKKNRPYQRKTKYTDGNITTIIDLNNGVPKSKDEQFRLDLVDKIINSSVDRYQFGTFDKGGPNNYKGILKLIINYSKAYYSKQLPDENMPINKDPINKLQYCLLIKDENCGRMEKSFLHSKPIIWLANNYKRRGQTGFCDAVKRQVMPYFKTQMWTDKDVYKIMKLTPTEVARIEADFK